MELINLYVQEVTRRLPEKMRDDIAMELHSTIEDMLQEDYSVSNVKQKLGKLGHPASLASQYSNKPMYLIGPKLYDLYISILKMVVPISALVVLIIFFFDKIVWITETETLPYLLFLTLSGELIWALLGMVVQVFFWVTISFIILDRTILPSVTTPLTSSWQKWTPDDLDEILHIPLKKAITKGEILFGLFWTFIWATLYFNATKLIGIYQSSESQTGLEFTLSIFNEATLMSYWPFIVLLIIIEVAMTIYKWISRQWTYKMAISNAIVNLIGISLLVIIVSNPTIFNPELAPYMAGLLDSSSEAIDSKIHLISWIIVLSVIVTSIIDIYNGFRKSKIT